MHVKVREFLHSMQSAKSRTQLPLIIQRISWFFWVLLLIALPFTSSPQVARLLVWSIINPLSGLFLLPLMFIWMMPYLILVGRRLRGSEYLAAFLLAAFVATLLGQVRGVFPWKDRSVFDREVYAWISLAGGTAFYLVTITIVDSSEKLKKSLGWISAGALLMILWSLLQGFFILFRDGNYPGWLWQAHKWFSLRDLIQGRVSGFSYEPSWLAHQLNMLYFPVWIGLLSVMKLARTGKRAYVVTGLLFLLGLVVLVLSSSRIGMAGFFVIAGFLAASASVKAAGWIGRKARNFIPLVHPGMRRFLGRIISIAAWVGIVILVFFAASEAFRFAVHVEPRLERVLQVDWEGLAATPVSEIYPTIKGMLNSRFANMLLFGERFVYWEGAYNVFNRYPVFGIGLGNAGFYYRELLPAFSSDLPEVVEVMRDGSTSFPNPKNLWLRLLAETGITGFLLFINWMGWLLLQALRLKKHDSELFRAIGMAGVLGVLVMVVEGFSIDTFALPYYWILFGLVTAAAGMKREDVNIDQDLSEGQLNRTLEESG